MEKRLKHNPWLKSVLNVLQPFGKRVWKVWAAVSMDSTGRIVGHSFTLYVIHELGLQLLGGVRWNPGITRLGFEKIMGKASAALVH